MNKSSLNSATLQLETLNNQIASLEEFLQKEYYQKETSADLVSTNASLRRGARGSALLADQRDETSIIEHAWQVYSGAMRAAITGGADWPNLQLVAPATPEKIQWDDPKFGPYYFHKVAADLMNSQGSVYKKSSKSFAERYEHFLRDIKRTPIDADAEAKARTALGDYQQSAVDLTEIYFSINFQWVAFDERQRSGLPPALWITMDKYFELTERNRVIAAARQLRDLKYARFLYFTQQAYGGGETLYIILKRLETNPRVEVTLPGTTPGQEGGKTEVFQYQLSPSFPNWLQQVRQNSNPVRFHVRSDSYQYDYSRTSIAGGVGIGFGFFGVLAVGGRTTVNIDTKQSGFELSFTADIQPFDILPGSWYDSSAFDLFRNGPFFPGSPMDNHRKNGSLFGPNGFLNFRPARAIVAYKPEVTVKLRDFEYHYFKQVTRGAAGFFIGPFAVGVGGYYDVQKSVRWNDNSGEITLFDAPDIPHLLAFDSEAI